MKGRRKKEGGRGERIKDLFKKWTKGIWQKHGGLVFKLFLLEGTTTTTRLSGPLISPAEREKLLLETQALVTVKIPFFG